MEALWDGAWHSCYVVERSSDGSYCVQFPGFAPNYGIPLEYLRPHRAPLSQHVYDSRIELWYNIMQRTSTAVSAKRTAETLRDDTCFICGNTAQAAHIVPHSRPESMQLFGLTLADINSPRNLLNLCHQHEHSFDNLEWSLFPNPFSHSDWFVYVARTDADTDLVAKHDTAVHLNPIPYRRVLAWHMRATLLRQARGLSGLAPREWKESFPVRESLDRLSDDDPPQKAALCLANAGNVSKSAVARWCRDNGIVWKEIQKSGARYTITVCSECALATLSPLPPCVVTLSVTIASDDGTSSGVIGDST